MNSHDNWKLGKKEQYVSWKLKMKALLQFKGLWGLIDPTASATTSLLHNSSTSNNNDNSNSSTSQTGGPSLATRARYAREGEAKYLIYVHLSDDLLERVSDLETTLKIWNKLASLYERSSEEEMEKLLESLDQPSGISFEDKVLDYDRNLKRYLRIGGVISTKQQISKLLKIVPHPEVLTLKLAR
eukprot:snap_masked-scaffold_3-processed-gene-17.29-mRNA-1 protein AED:1.00 eAED:1.00 QI:0/-1/0/0/-1/1/1/0/184